MCPEIITTTSIIFCNHPPGLVKLQTTNNKVFIRGNPVLLEPDIQRTIIGCTFFRVNPFDSPCMEVKWKSGALRVKIDGKKVLLKSSIGECYNAGLLQGVSNNVQTQTEVFAK